MEITIERNRGGTVYCKLHQYPPSFPKREFIFGEEHLQQKDHTSGSKHINSMALGMLLEG